MDAFKPELLTNCQCHCPQAVTVRGFLGRGSSHGGRGEVGRRGQADAVTGVEGTCSPEQVSLPTVLLIQIRGCRGCLLSLLSLGEATKGGRRGSCHGCSGEDGANGLKIH